MLLVAPGSAKLVKTQFGVRGNGEVVRLGLSSSRTRRPMFAVLVLVA